MTDGVKVELDLYPEGATENPFAAISINHLRIKEAGKQAAYTVAPQGEYKDNLQLNIEEHINLEGFRIAGGLASYWPTDIYVTANAKLDLANATNNGTELYAALKLGHIDTTYEEEYLYGAGMPIELSYTKGKLTLRTDAKTWLLEASGAASISAYDMLLSGPIGNLMDELLSAPGYETQKAEFDALYWTGEHKFNTNFQGLIVNNLEVQDIFNMIAGALTAPKTDANEPATSSAEEVSTNYIDVISYLFGLISSHEDGKLTLTSKDGLLGTVAKFAQLLNLDKLTTTEGEGEQATVTPYDWNKAGIIDWAVNTLDPLIKGFTGGLVGASFLFAFDGVSGSNLNETFDMVFEEAPDAIQIAFDFTKGFDWDIKLGMHEDPGIAINWTSRIRFGEAAAVQNIKDRLKKDIEELTKTVTDLKIKSDAADKAYNDADAAYKATAEYIDMNAKNSTLSGKKTPFYKSEGLANAIKPVLKSNQSVVSIMSMGAKNSYDYWLQRYLYEEQKDESAKELMDTYYAASEDYFVKNCKPTDYAKSDDEYKADVKKAYDAAYEVFKEQLGEAAAAYANALKTAQATEEYATRLTKLTEKNKANWVYKYQNSRLTAYKGYNCYTYAELKAALDAATTADPAYNSARETVDNAITQAFGTADQTYQEAVKVISDAVGFMFGYGVSATLDDYCAHYAANKEDAQAITNETVQAKLDALKASISYYSISDEQIQAVVDAYCAAFDVTVTDGKATGVKKSDSLKNALNDYLKYYAGNKQDAETITATTVTEKLNALKAIITANKLEAGLSDATIADLAEKYAAAYEVKLDLINKTVTGETNKLSYYTNAVSSYNWFEMDFKAAAKA